MSNHKDSLVKVLEYLVNEDRDKAAELLHDVFVEKAKNHWASLTESDESVEEDIQDEDLDETYDVEVDEGIDTYDAEQDFLSDIETAEDEIEAEEVFGEDDDEADDEVDMAADMGMGDEAEGDEPEAEEALANVEDAIAELRAAFADLMGDEEAPAEEPEEMDMEMPMEASKDDDEEVEAVEEGATMSAVSVSHTDGSDNSKSPVGPGDSSMSPSKPVDIAGGTVEAGGKAPAAKDMGVTGPQEAGSPKPAPAPKREMK